MNPEEQKQIFIEIDKICNLDSRENTIISYVKRDELMGIDNYNNFLEAIDKLKFYYPVNRVEMLTEKYNENNYKPFDFYSDLTDEELACLGW